MGPLNLLESLQSANWRLASRTYGSSHATLIGIVADWWIKLEPDRHTVLDGAPSFGERNAGWCDLMLCEGNLPRGVVEVEGTKSLDKIASLEAYFGSERQGLGGIGFALLVVYAYSVKGRGPNRRYPTAEQPNVYAEALRMSERHPSKAVLLVAIDKAVDPDPGPIRLSSPYHLGFVSQVTGSLLLHGQEQGRQRLWASLPSQPTIEPS